MSEDGEREPDPERVQARSRERQHDRAESVEAMTENLGEMLGEHKYPVTAEELSVEYADQELDLPNETESLGDVFDRLVDERFDSPDEAREAILNEFTGAADGPAEFNDGRALSELDDDEA